LRTSQRICGKNLSGRRCWHDSHLQMGGKSAYPILLAPGTDLGLAADDATDLSNEVVNIVNLFSLARFSQMKVKKFDEPSLDYAMSITRQPANVRADMTRASNGAWSGRVIEKAKEDRSRLTSVASMAHGGGVHAVRTTPFRLLPAFLRVRVALRVLCTKREYRVTCTRLQSG
jgi:hypothetical protein